MYVSVEKGGAGSKKIYIKLAINLHFNVMMCLGRDRPTQAQITFLSCSHEDRK